MGRGECNRREQILKVGFCALFAGEQKNIFNAALFEAFNFALKLFL